MKQIEKNRESFLKYGLSDDLITKLIREDSTVSKVRSASKKDLMKFLSREEAESVKEKIKRQPIPDNVFERLVNETELHCCFCWDIFNEEPIIIHHINNGINHLIIQEHYKAIIKYRILENMLEILDLWCTAVRGR